MAPRIEEISRGQNFLEANQLRPGGRACRDWVHDGLQAGL